MSRTETVAAPRTVLLYPETEYDAKRMIDKLRDDVRTWQLTAKTLYDDYVKVLGLLEAERRRNAKKG